MSWDANRPRDRDKLGELAEQWRSDKTFLDDYFQTFLSWGDDTSNAGRPKDITDSTTTYSNAVAFVVPRSQVSYRRPGDMFLISDESCFAINNSSESVTLFSNKAVIQYHNNTDGGGTAHSLNTGSRVMIVHGVNTLTTNALNNVTFGETFGAAPSVSLTLTSTDDASSASFLLGMSAVNESGMSIFSHYAGPGGAPGNISRVLWRSSGTTSFK